MHEAIRYHDFCAGHRVAGHENKCKHLHGHNYRIYFHCEAQLDEVGRVIDFSVIKEKLCLWLEDNWDHRFLVWENDPLADDIIALDDHATKVPFNPTAENMAEYLVTTVAPKQFAGTGVTLRKCVVEETRKCSASYKLQEVPAIT